MKKILFLFIALTTLTLGAFAQTKEANPADVASVDSIIKAVYEVISGDAGKERDWDRFRSLFVEGARLIPTTGKNKDTGLIAARIITPEEYIKRSGPFLLKEGFHEREVARRVEQYGNIAHVFSTYDSKHKVSDEKPFMRGINSFQLMNDGKRWWIVTIYWQAETQENPIPKQYLKSKN
ncbi:MAG TPA: hypothetical protein VJL58_04600 [Pyrinomonadaceae bacterium]|nr:hypothetical protein [Pyrinomonadaceae bacterium]